MDMNKDELSKKLKEKRKNIIKRLMNKMIARRAKKSAVFSAAYVINNIKKGDSPTNK